MPLGVSHPVWVCGLKLLSVSCPFMVYLSHPVWVCGLKLSNDSAAQTAYRVTPCMGVWIETVSPNDNRRHRASHPVWVCGLKQEKTLITSRN